MQDLDKFSSIDIYQTVSTRQFGGFTVAYFTSDNQNYAETKENVGLAEIDTLVEALKTAGWQYKVVFTYFSIIMRFER